MSLAKASRMVIFATELRREMSGTNDKMPENDLLSAGLINNCQFVVSSRRLR